MERQVLMALQRTVSELRVEVGKLQAVNADRAGSCPWRVDIARASNKSKAITALQVFVYGGGAFAVVVGLARLFGVI